MTNNIPNTSGIRIEAEIQSAWLPFIYQADKKITELTNSIIYKLLQSHYHLVQAIRNSRLSIESMKKFPFDQNKQYYDFITNCNIDSMIYALNSLMDVVAKLLVKIYFDIDTPDTIIKPTKPPNMFKDLKKKENITYLNCIDPDTTKIIKSFFKLKERKYVNTYCNANKHEKAFFASGSYFYFDTETDKEKPEFVTGYNLKERYKVNNSNNKELEYYAQRLDKIHRDKICQLGKSISRFKEYEIIEADDNFLNIVTMYSNKYFR